MNLDSNKSSSDIIYWILETVLKYRKKLYKILFYSLSINIFSLVSPFIMMTITDRIIVYQGLATLNILILGFTIFVIFESFIEYVRAYIATIASMRITIELSSRIYEHLIRRSMSYFDSRATGEILSRIGEIHNIKDFLTRAPITTIIDLLFVIIFIFVILYISPILSFITIASIQIQIIIVWLSNKIRAKFMQDEFFMQ